MADKIFTEGLVIIQPREGAPSWVKGRLSIKVASFVKFLEEHIKEDGWVNIDICESKAGDKWYGTLNNFKPQRQEEKREITPDDIPF